MGWFTRGYQYLEFSLDGMEIGRYEGPVGGNINDISGVAMSEAGDVVVSRTIRSVDGKSYTTDFFQLDRGARTWLPVTLTGPGGWARAIGFDGRTLITSRFNGQMSRFTEVK